MIRIIKIVNPLIVVVFLIFFKILLVADMSLIGYETLAKKVPLSLRENEK